MLKSRTVVITGGCGGIGSAMVEAFAKQDDRVAFSYMHSKEAALKLKFKLQNINPSVECFYADLRDCESVIDFYKNVKNTYGTTQILINNAAISQQKLFCDISEDDWQNMIGVNLTGTFRVTKAFLPDMLSAKKGCIINISSIWGVCGASCETHYSATKAGVIGLTKALAKETALCNVRVNCIAPGLIKTKMNSALSLEDKLLFTQDVPLNREGTPEEVAQTALFLASDNASYITGQTINVDGGYNI